MEIAVRSISYYVLSSGLATLVSYEGKFIMVAQYERYSGISHSFWHSAKHLFTSLTASTNISRTSYVVLLYVIM